MIDCSVPASLARSFRIVSALRTGHCRIPHHHPALPRRACTKREAWPGKSASFAVPAIANSNFLKSRTLQQSFCRKLLGNSAAL